MARGAALAPAWTYYASLALQLVSLVVSCVALGTARRDGPERLVFDSLVAELVVNLVQLAWYGGLWIASRARPDAVSLHALPPYWRYIDWVVTTSVMLLSVLCTGSYFSTDPYPSLLALLKGEPLVVFNAIVANACMLLFGLIAELFKEQVSRGARVALLLAGFLPFAQVWALIFAAGAGTAGAGTWVCYALTCAVWALYGVAAHLPTHAERLQASAGRGRARPPRWPPTQNEAYNLLDAVAKNVYSLALSIILWVGHL